MGFLWTLIIGLVVGAIAKLIMPGRDPGGIIVTMLIGVAGALLAGFLGGRWVGIRTRERAPGSSLRSSAPSSCCSCTGCSRAAGVPRLPEKNGSALSERRRQGRSGG